MARRDSDTPLSTRLFRWLVALCAIALLWLGGGLAYLERVETFTPPDSEVHSDAIVVLTGGAVRLSTALRLLNDGKAERLLVSGVAPTTTKATLMQAAIPAMPDSAQASNDWSGIDLQLLFDCCVDLGFEAEDTAGNAVEAASWARARGYKSLRVVTANYHMPRAMAEFRRRLSDITVLPHPVRSDAMRVEDWWQRRTATLFLLGEYTKYVAALLRAHLDVLLEETVAESTARKAPDQKAVE
ncbi:MAG: YdcF family protein [Ferrovibrio sp.]|uniref:YdcF family protein n=1 Tax=Ferrovibrio sp. TaxID=1917215 RepID=UPI003918E587